MPPKGWPDSVRYIQALDWATECPKELVRVYQGKSTTQDAEEGLRRSVYKPVVVAPPRQPCQAVRIAEVKDPAHPAFRQKQLLANSSIPKGGLILDYLGVVRPSSTESRSSNYIIALGHGLSIDAEFAGNESRFVNDYRGVTAKPNAEFELSMRKESGAVNMSIWATQELRKGDEILVSYGKGFWHARCCQQGT